MAIFTAKYLVPGCTHVTDDAVTLKCGMSRAMVATHYLAMPFSTRQRSLVDQPSQWHWQGVDNFGAGATRTGRSERCPEAPVDRARPSKISLGSSTGR
jgi:hypothetical protein